MLIAQQQAVEWSLNCAFNVLHGTILGIVFKLFDIFSSFFPFNSFFLSFFVATDDKQVKYCLSLDYFFSANIYCPSLSISICSHHENHEEAKSTWHQRPPANFSHVCSFISQDYKYGEADIAFVFLLFGINNAVFLFVLLLRCFDNADMLHVEKNIQHTTIPNGSVGLCKTRPWEGGISISWSCASTSYNTFLGFLGSGVKWTSKKPLSSSIQWCHNWTYWYG